MFKAQRLILAAFLILAAIGFAIAQDDEDGDNGDGADETASATAQVVDQDVTYIVQLRDNLDRIGALFDVRPACIRETNNLSPGHILQPGDALLISASCPAYDGADIVVNRRENAPGRLGEPIVVIRQESAQGSDASAGGTIVVRRGDTLDAIGQELNISVEALKQANGIVFGRELKIGQVLQIPANAPAYGVFPALTSSPRAETAQAQGQGGQGGDEVYVVQLFDTLDGIGARFDKNHYCIIEANEITNVRAIRPGLAIVIPADCGPYTGFDVVGGAG